MLNHVAVSAAEHIDGPWGSGFGFFFLLVPFVWLGVLLLIFGLVGRRWRRAGWSGPEGRAPWAHAGRSAENTLGERFAQGDIDEKEYRSRLEVLRANNLPPQTKR